MNKIGFIGYGNMARCIAEGLLDSKEFLGKNIYIYDRNENKREAEKEKLNVVDSEVEVAKESDIIFLAIKPNKYEEVIKKIKDIELSNKIFISITPNFTLETLKTYFEKDVKIIRTMPNTPAFVKEGMTAYVKNELIIEEDEETVVNILEKIGKVEEVEENIMNVVVGVSGSSPAYVFMFIEAMADAAVLGGMSREKAYKFAAQALVGSAKMILEMSEHPGKLKDMVCSPGGTSIEAVRELEKNGFRSSIIEAMIKCMEKARSI